MINQLKGILTKSMPQKILFFEHMLAPSIIRFVYWLCLIVMLCNGVYRMFASDVSGFFIGFISTIMGLILIRLAAELVILLFKVNEKLAKLTRDDQMAQTPKLESE